MGKPQDPLQARLQRWSRSQAWTMLAASGAAWLVHAPVIASAAAAVSFGVLITRNRGEWTPRGIFGAANTATLMRLLIVLGLPFALGFSPTSRFVLALAALALDGVDGWLARRLNLCSAFGAHFDQEVDALFTAMLGLILLREGLLGPWILVPGALRYVFVLFIAFARPPEPRETATIMGKVICVATLLALMACLLPLPRIRAPLALAGTLLLCGSFAVSIRRMYDGKRAVNAATSRPA